MISLTSKGDRIFKIRHLLQRNNELLASSVMLKRNAHRIESCQSGRFTDIGTRRIFTKEHDMFRENVRKFMKEEVIPYHEKWEEKGEVDREMWLKAGKAGILGVNSPSEKGGQGGDWLSSLIVHEELAYSNCSGPGFGLHNDIALPYIVDYGTKEQVEKFVSDAVAGRKIVAIAMTEPGAGSDLQGIKTHAKRDGDDWILNGQKVFITNGWLSDIVVVVALTSTDVKSPAHGLSLFIVEAGTKGFTKGKKLKKLGYKAQDTSELFFEDCRLPSTALLGGEECLNKGFPLLMKQLPQERMMIGNFSVASAEFIFEITRDYVTQRKAFGKHISDLQTIQHKLAEMKTEIAVARAFSDRCAELHNDRRCDSSTASMVKWYGSDLNNTVANRCLQMFGGWGFMWEYPIAKAFVDARLQPIYGGSNEIMKELIARQILQDP